ncbi:MAG: ribonuclease H, partial [Chryseobacterium sp.]
MPKRKFYVVWVGRQPGVYTSWPDCEKQVKGFENATYK